MSNRKLPSDPVTGITIKLGKQARLRGKGFTDAEAKAILSAALRLTRGGETAGTFAAKRWVPWLAAYTGARVGELAQLRKQGVTREGDHWTNHRPLFLKVGKDLDVLGTVAEPQEPPRGVLPVHRERPERRAYAGGTASRGWRPGWCLSLKFCPPDKRSRARV